MVIQHSEISNSQLKSLIRNKSIILGGNQKLKIYGTLHCKSGKRMKKGNRIFFQFEQEALESGFRPCGHCMHRQYKRWKAALDWIQV